MAEASFTPYGSSVADDFNTGVERQQSMMSRASQNRQQLQMEEIRKQEIAQRQALLPVLEAKNRADIVGANAAVANAARMENLRAKAAALSPMANNEFLDALQLSDFESKATALAGLQAKYQWMSLIPDYKGFVDTINEERVKAHGSAVADANMERQLEEERLRYERAVDVAKIGAGSREAVAATSAEARRNVASTSAGARVDSANIGAEARKDVAAGNRDASMARTELRAAHQSAIEADKEAFKAVQAGDEELAGFYRKRADNFRAQADKAAKGPEKPVEFDIPNVTSARKLYTPPAQPGETISISPEVRKPAQIIEALQQAVNDGQMTAEQARETLQKLGFKKKQ